MKSYLGLGTNLGDRSANIRCAIDMINEQAGHVLACSSFVETEPWGFVSDNAFLNAVIEIDTSLTPYELLRVTQGIERSMGRTRKSINGNYSDRIIDIDILLFGDNKIDCEELTVPHKLMYERDFVMMPLKEINDKL